MLCPRIAFCSVVGADFNQNILTEFIAADFRGQIIHPAVKQAEFLQPGQQGFEWGKPANTEAERGEVAAELFAPGEVERLERGEAGEREEVAAELFAPGEVERLERGEAGQVGEVCELPAPGEVERSERGKAFQLWRELNEFR
jgi:hypothetical protein